VPLPKQLLEYVPYGLVVTRAWLRDQGIAAYTIDNWRKSGRLEAVAQGVLKQPGATLAWQGVVCSLQRMGYSLVVGGVSALEQHGLGHYAALSATQEVHLYGPDRLPTWVSKILPDVQFTYHKDDCQQDAVQAMPTGVPGSEMQVASPELAILQVLSAIPKTISFEYANNLFQGLGTLSPRRLQSLLNTSLDIKTKRLFLWFAKRHQHPWLQRLDLSDLSMESGNLGRGKRVLIKGGKLDPTYLITVPREMQDG
jgi:hypothetical protein